VHAPHDHRRKCFPAHCRHREIALALHRESAQRKCHLFPGGAAANAQARVLQQLAPRIQRWHSPWYQHFGGAEELLEVMKGTRAEMKWEKVCPVSRFCSQSQAKFASVAIQEAAVQQRLTRVAA
jgi:hypothetical protein